MDQWSIFHEVNILYDIGTHRYVSAVWHRKTLASTTPYEMFESN